MCELVYSNIMEILEVDCSSGEGGGQVVRNVSAYACLLSKSLTLKGIRAGREKSGLRAQHVTCLKVLSQMTNASFTGVEVGSTCVTIYNTIKCANELKHKHPSSRKKGETRITGPTGTAGSLVLVIQAALPCALFYKKSCNLELGGGTNAAMAPQIDYFTEVFLPTIKKILKPAVLGSSSKSRNCTEFVRCDILKRGYYPKGGGFVRIKVEPIHSIQPFSLVDRGVVAKVKILSWNAGRCPISVAHKMAKYAQARLISNSNECRDSIISISLVNDSEAIDNACGILLVAETDKGCVIAGSAMGRRGIKPEITADNATNDLLDNLDHGGCVDEWLQDQLIIYMALADGESTLRTGPLTLHTQTAILYATKISGASFSITKVSSDSNNSITLDELNYNDSNCAYGKRGKIEGNFVIRSKGIGLENDHVPRRKT